MVGMFFCRRLLGRLNSNFGLWLDIVCGIVLSILVRVLHFLLAPRYRALLSILSVTPKH